MSKEEKKVAITQIASILSLILTIFTLTGAVAWAGARNEQLEQNIRRLNEVQMKLNEITEKQIPAITVHASTNTANIEAIKERLDDVKANTDKIIDLLLEENSRWAKNGGSHGKSAKKDG